MRLRWHREIDGPIIDDSSHDVTNQDVPCHETKGPKRTTPNTATSIVLYETWRELVPTLTAPLLAHISASLGKVLPPPDHLKSTCGRTGICMPKTLILGDLI